MNLISKTITTCAFVALSSTAAMAAGQAPRSVTVEHADLDLSSEAGQKTLERRLHRAAKSVCENNDDRLSVSVRKQVNTCMAASQSKRDEPHCFQDNPGHYGGQQGLNLKLRRSKRGGEQSLPLYRKRRGMGQSAHYGQFASIVPDRVDRCRHLQLLRFWRQ